MVECAPAVGRATLGGLAHEPERTQEAIDRSLAVPSSKRRDGESRHADREHGSAGEEELVGEPVVPGRRAATSFAVTRGSTLTVTPPTETTRFAHASERQAS